VCSNVYWAQVPVRALAQVQVLVLLLGQVPALAQVLVRVLVLVLVRVWRGGGTSASTGIGGSTRTRTSTSVGVGASTNTSTCARTSTNTITRTANSKHNSTRDRTRALNRESTSKFLLLPRAWSESVAKFKTRALYKAAEAAEQAVGTPARLMLKGVDCAQEVGRPPVRANHQGLPVRRPHACSAR